VPTNHRAEQDRVAKRKASPSTAVAAVAAVADTCTNTTPKRESHVANSASGEEEATQDASKLVTSRKRKKPARDWEPAEDSKLRELINTHGVGDRGPKAATFKQPCDAKGLANRWRKKKKAWIETYPELAAAVNAASGKKPAKAKVSKL
jgi:hypothetical protein